VALGGKGLSIEDVVDAVWAAEQDSPEVRSLRPQEEALLKSLKPGAAFRAV